MNKWDILGWFVLVFGLIFILIVTVDSIFMWYGIILVSFFGAIVLTTLDKDPPK